LGNESHLHSTYTRQISDEALLALRNLIGKTVGRIYASCLQVAGAHYTAPSFSIPVTTQTDSGWDHRFTVIRCDWFETPKLLNDYWKIHVIEQEKPDGIETNSTGAIVAPCTVSFWHASPITRIDIHSFQWIVEGEDSEESVLYDNAICFRTSSEKSFCVACQLNGPGIATEVHLSGDAETIQEFLTDSTLRHSLS
jgi:hypothetical protein